MEGLKKDAGKPRFSLLPPGTLLEVVEVLTFGAQKYADDNWMHVGGARKRYYDALQRHVEAWWQGEVRDPETGRSHLAHAVCCALFLMWFDRHHAPTEPFHAVQG